MWYHSARFQPANQVIPGSIPGCVFFTSSRFNLQYRTAETEESGDAHSVSEAANSPADDHQEKAGQNSAAVENVGSKAKADEITLGELKHGQSPRENSRRVA